MAQDLAGVINQLRNNNEEERARDSNLNQNIAQSRRENTEALATLAKNLSEQFVTVVKTTDQEQQQREADREKDAARVAAGTKAWQTRQENLKKKEAGLASANEEKDNRMMRVFTALGAGIKGLNTKFGSFAKSFTDSIKSKVKGGVSAIFDIFKKFAIVGALAGLLAFLDSETWKNLKEDYLDPTLESFKTLKEKFSNIGQTFEDIKAGFFNEKGEFTPIAGIKNTLTEISELFDGTGAALMTIGGLTLFAFRKRVIRLAKGLGARLLSMSGITNVFGNNLDTVNKDMRDRNTRAKRRGIFSKGFRGIGKRFGRLFLRMGAFGALIGGASLLMGDRLKEAGGVKGVFAGIKDKFGQLFGKIGQLGSKIAKAATDMGTKVTTAVTEGVLSAKGKIMTGFTSMFDALGNLGKGIKDLAGKAAGKVKSTLAGTADDIDGKKTTPKRPEEIAREKRLAAQNDEALKKKQAANLERMKAERLAAEKKAKADAAEMKKKMDAFREADLKSRKAAIPKIALDSKKLGKEVAKATARFGTKMVPLLGAGFGIFEAGRRLLQGDLVGAGLETGGIFAPSVTGIPIDATLMGRDVYKGMFGTQYESDLAKDPATANARMAQIKDAIMKAIAPEQTAADGSEIKPYQDAIMRTPPTVVVNKGGDVVNGGDTNVGIVGMRDLSHGGMRMGYR